MAMHNIKLTLAYDGKGYLGWQSTPGKTTLEETLQTALEKIYQHPIGLQAASRTDAGVHANGQIVNFLTSKETDPDKLYAALNRLLPKDFIVHQVEIVPLKFHPTLDSLAKEYHYDLVFDRIQSPKDRFYAWHYPYPLDIVAMEKASQLLVGEHDFSAFCNLKAKEEYSHYKRHVMQIDVILCQEKCLKFVIIGNNFLYRMVRNLVGTLVYVGAKKISVTEISKILEKKDRRLIGPTAPAHGLTLQKVYYSPTYAIN